MSPLKIHTTKIIRPRVVEGLWTRRERVSYLSPNSGQALEKGQSDIKSSTDLFPNA